MEQKILLLFLSAPALFLLTFLLSASQKRIKPRWVISLALFSAVISMLISVAGGYFVYRNGMIASGTPVMGSPAFSIRLDTVSLIMFAMISFLSFVILKFSINYLDGDSRQGLFIGRLAGTLSSVQMLVIAGDLFILVPAWILTSVMLHYLLTFYADRKGAQIAAKKKFVMARLGDVFLIATAFLLYRSAGSGNLEAIFSWVKNTELINLPYISFELPVLLLLITAFLKSAQFPTHGWLIEVMETPTPVSALLHAGLLNAGPFLIIRMAFLIEASAYASTVLLFVGALSAIFGSVVYMTQPSVKTALGYSSVAHMGFSFLVSGLGVYSASMLHLVGHSFYKAHAFLSSGSAVDIIRASRYEKSTKPLTLFKAIAGLFSALVVYAFMVWLFKVDIATHFSLVVLGAVIVLGLTKVFAQAYSSNHWKKLIFQSVFLAVTVTFAFFSFESLISSLLGNQVPEPGSSGMNGFAVPGLVLLIFTLIIALQMIAPQLKKRSLFLKMSIHFRNGLYANAIFDRMINALSIKKEKYHPAVDSQGFAAEITKEEELAVI